MAQYRQSVTAVAGWQVAPERNQPLLHLVHTPVLGQIAQFASIQGAQTTPPVGK